MKLRENNQKSLEMMKKVFLTSLFTASQIERKLCKKSFPTSLSTASQILI